MENPDFYSILLFWKSKAELLTSKDLEINQNIKKKHLDIIKKMGPNLIYLRINNYCRSLNNDSPYCHYYTFWEFLENIGEWSKVVQPNKTH